MYKFLNNICNKCFGGNMTIFLICVIVLILIYTVFLQLIGSTPNAFNFIGSFIHLPKGMDSWNPMILALTHCKQFPDTDLYQTLLIENSIKFQYPPTSLLLFDIPERIFGIAYLKIAKIYDILSLVSIFLTVFFTSQILIKILKKYNFQTITKSAHIYTYILIFVITAFFYPLVWSYNLGQIQTILTMLATIALYLYLSDRKKLAGLCLGLICLVKPQLGLIFVWGLIRKEWSMVIYGAITVMVVLLPSILLYGFHNHLDYLTALSHLSQYGESFHANQSINGLMHRLLFNGNNLEWLGNSFPPYNPVVYFTTLFSSIIFIFFGLLWNFKNPKPNVIEMALMMLCTTMASPIAWEQHYSILLPIFVLLSPFVLHYFKNEKWKILIFVLAFAVSTQYFGTMNKFADSYLNILQSYLYFSALVILIFLFSISKKIKKCNT